MTMKKSFAMSLVLAFALTGCGPKQDVPQVDVKYYPECYDPIAKLCKDSDHTDEAKAAAEGAALGAVSGALAGGLLSGNAEGAAKGAAAGALVGGTAGFAKAHSEKVAEQKQRLAEYQKVLGAESQQWDLARATVEASYKCYSEQFAMVKEAYKSGKMSKEEALARANEIKSGITALNAFWEDTNKKFDTNTADMTKYIAEEEARIAQIKNKKEKAKAQKALAQIKKPVDKQKGIQETQNQQFKADFAGFSGGIDDFVTQVSKM